MTTPTASVFDNFRWEQFETSAILKRVAGASRQLAELKGVSASIPNQEILINMLGLQEAKELSVSRLTAAKYLDALSASGFLHKQRIGRSNYYVNVTLYQILTGTRYRRISPRPDSRRKYNVTRNERPRR